MDQSPAISTFAIPGLLAGLGPIFGRQVTIEIRPNRDREAPGRALADFSVSLAWGIERWEFAAEAKTRSTPRELEDALRRARRWAAESARLPMVIVPYLGEKRIERLEEEGISGLDLCGNGLIIVPGRVVLRRTGEQNRYPESRPARFAYRGVTSLVPRVFLRRTEYSTVGQVRDEIEAAGGAVALSTVSKALTKMTDDVIVDRSEGRIVLVQGDKLLDALLESYVSPRAERTSHLKMQLPLEEFFRRSANDAGPAPKLRTVLSGASAQDRYAGGLRADAPVVYTDDFNELKRRIGDAWTPVDRFATLTVVETRDPTPYFDARRTENGAWIASPVQSYLELGSGDKRDAEMAQQIRARILRDLVR